MQRQRSIRGAWLLVIALVLLPILSCEWFASQGTAITSVVLARDVAPDSLEPLEITDIYAQDQPEFHAVVSLSNAPSGTVVKAVWTAIEVGSAAPQNTIINQSEQKAQGTQNLHFAVSPDIGRWPAGSYRMELYVNGELNRTVNFHVAPSATPESKGVVLVCPALPAPSLEASDIVMSVTMAPDVSGENKEPVGETTIFPPSATFHAVVLVVDAPAGTKVTATWYATDLGELSSCNTRLLESNVVVDDTRNVDFSMMSQIPWPHGRYRVEISVDGELVQVVPFEVSSTARSESVPAGQH